MIAAGCTMKCWPVQISGTSPPSNFRVGAGSQDGDLAYGMDTWGEPHGSCLEKLAKRLLIMTHLF